MSLVRKIQRNIANRTGQDWPSRTQYTEYSEDGGYVTLHPTKGWQRISGSRIRAREQMAMKYGFIR